MKTISDKFIKSTARDYDMDEQTVLRIYNKNCVNGELDSESFYAELESDIEDYLHC